MFNACLYNAQGELVCTKNAQNGSASDNTTTSGSSSDSDTEHFAQRRRRRGAFGGPQSSVRIPRTKGRRQLTDADWAQRVTKKSFRRSMRQSCFQDDRTRDANIFTANWAKAAARIQREADKLPIPAERQQRMARFHALYNRTFNSYIETLTERRRQLVLLRSDPNPANLKRLARCGTSFGPLAPNSVQ